MASAQQLPDVSGYTVDGNRIIVKGMDHWRFWETPEGVGVIDEDGNAHPRFLRRDINAVANAVSFMNVAGADTTTGGISSVGFLRCFVGLGCNRSRGCPLPPVFL